VSKVQDITESIEQYKKHTGHYPNVVRVGDKVAKQSWFHELEHYCKLMSIHLEIMEPEPSGYQVP
jgi:hypothetical protein